MRQLEGISLAAVPDGKISSGTFYDLDEISVEFTPWAFHNMMLGGFFSPVSSKLLSRGMVI